MVNVTNVRIRIDKKALDREMLSRDGSVGHVIAAFGGNVTKEIKNVFRERAGGAWWPVKTTIGETGRGTYANVRVIKSRPHKIRVRNAPALVFFWERENTIFVGQSVNHPGSSPPVKLILSGIERAGRRLTFTRAAPVVTNE
jgi:hypothetical protein